MEVAAAGAAWLGVSLLVLSDGRRGIALGVTLAALGLSGVSVQPAGVPAALLLATGGMAAAARRFAAGPPGWGIMPAGSTPRLVMCLAGGILALWVGLAVTSGGSGALRFTVMAVTGLAGARVLSSDGPPVLLSAIGVLALAVAAASALDGGVTALWPALAASVLAAVLVWIPLRTPRAA